MNGKLEQGDSQGFRERLSQGRFSGLECSLSYTSLQSPPSPFPSFYGPRRCWRWRRSVYSRRNKQKKKKKVEIPSTLAPSGGQHKLSCPALSYVGRERMRITYVVLFSFFKTHEQTFVYNLSERPNSLAK